MKKKINRRLMGTAALAIIATLLLTAAVCYNFFKNQVIADLKIYAGIVSYIGALPDESLKERLDEDHIRVSVIRQDGIVVYDTEANPETMGNHMDRPEIQEAFRTGEGSKVRKSDTLNRNTYYYAMLREDGSVLRIAKDADSIYRIMESIVPYMLVMVLILFGICGISSHFMAEGIMRPIRLIAENVENVQRIEAYDEMRPFIEAIKNQHDDVLQNARMRQEFTANVSHELKTPLTAISGYSELIESGMVSQESEIRRFAGEIHSNANRLLTLINDVIRLSELDAEETEEQREPVNLRESAVTCVNVLQINAEKHHVSLSFKGENVMVMASRQMIEEVLYNLCDNAIRYNKPGGSVEVIVKDRLNVALLIVRDTGIGIPKEHQERIFERFYRVDKSRSKSTGGTGLGLAIVKLIIMKLNASITLTSEEGKGTEVTVTLPAVRESRIKS